MSSIGKLMKQAARMQQQMEEIQNQLAQRTVEATSGGGAVKVVAKCDGTIASIKIDPHWREPRTMTSSPTARMPLNISLRLLAMVIS